MKLPKEVTDTLWDSVREKKKHKPKEDSYSALFISDIHLSNKLPYAVPTSNGMTDRLQEQEKIFDSILEQLEKHPETNDVYILGDMFDKGTVDPVTLTFAAKQIARLLKIKRTTVYILPGNHDSNSTKGGRFITEAFGAMGFDRLISLRAGMPELKGDGGWLRFFSLPYSTKEVAENTLRDYEDSMSHGDGFTNVLLMHHSINGCETINWVCDDGLDADSFVQNYSLTLSGHFHEHQFFGEDLQGMYLGSPMHHRFDDVGRAAGYWLIEFQKDGNHKLEHIDPGLAKFWMLKDTDETIPSSAKIGDFIRYRVKATKEDWRDIKPGLMVVIDDLNAGGFRADFLFSPITSSKARIPGEGTTYSGSVRVRSIEEQIGLYAEHVGHKELEEIKKLGKEIFEEARLVR